MPAPRNPIEYRNALGIRPFSPAFTIATKAIYGIPFDPSERPLFAKLSGGRTERPGVGWTEAFINAGRGSGKDDWLKSVAPFECRFGGHEVAAAPGQRLPFLIVCPLRYQAQGTLRFVAGEAGLPFNKRYVTRETADAVEFSNGTLVQVQTCDTIAVVGDTVCGIGFNEWALFDGDAAAQSARAVEGNIRPALRRMEGAPPKRFIKVSSSYIKDGPPWETFRDDFGNDDSDVLVLHGTTLDFNPNIDRAWLAHERKKLGPILAAMHFDSVWQDALIIGYFGADTLGPSLQVGKPELPYAKNVPVNIAFDAAFSQTGDRCGYAVAQPLPESSRMGIIAAGAWVVDRKPSEMAIRLRDEVCDRFGTRHITIDQYCAPVFAEICEQVGLTVTIHNWSAGDGDESKSSLYRNFKLAMGDGRLLLCDNRELVRDICACRATLLPGGGERIEVPRTRRGHGDCLSAAVLAVHGVNQSMAGVAGASLVDAFDRPVPANDFTPRHNWQLLLDDTRGAFCVARWCDRNWWQIWQVDMNAEVQQKGIMRPRLSHISGERFPRTDAPSVEDRLPRLRIEGLTRVARFWEQPSLCELQKVARQFGASKVHIASEVENQDHFKVLKGLGLQLVWHEVKAERDSDVQEVVRRWYTLRQVSIERPRDVGYDVVLPLMSIVARSEFTDDRYQKFGHEARRGMLREYGQKRY